MSSKTNVPYKCEECGMSFNSLEELQDHINEQHVAMPWSLKFLCYSFFRDADQFLARNEVTTPACKSIKQISMVFKW